MQNVHQIVEADRFPEAPAVGVAARDSNLAALDAPLFHPAERALDQSVLARLMDQNANTLEYGYLITMYTRTGEVLEYTFKPGDWVNIAFTSNASIDP